MSPRRTSRTLTALLAATALAVTAALSGCASAVQQAKSGGSAGDDTLRVGITTDLQTGTPFSNASDGDDLLIGLVYDKLVTENSDSLTPHPSLATSWKLADDGRSLTLRLRKGVTFSDGKPLTPADVEYSIKQWADPTWAVQFQRTAAAITGFDTSQPDQITLRFAHPLVNIFDLLSELPILDSAQAAGLKSGKKYVGTGPFELASWVPGSKLVFKRNPDYWGGKPKLTAVDAEIAPDQQALVSQLRSGQLDLIVGAGNRDLETLAASKKYDVQSLTGAEQQIYVGASLTNSALQNPDLRKAIAYAVDRPRIVKDVYRGAGYPVNLPWPTYSPAYSAALNHTYDRNVSKAKTLATSALKGSTKAIPLEYDGGDSNLEATAQIVQSDLAQAGIKVSLVPLDHTTFIKELIGAKFKGLWLAIHSYAQWNPATLVVSAYPFNAAHNASHFSSTAYSTAAQDAWTLRSPSGSTATSAYAALNKQLLDSNFLIELAVTYLRIASSPRVHDVTWSKRQELDLSKTYLSKG